MSSPPTAGPRNDDLLGDDHLDLRTSYLATRATDGRGAAGGGYFGSEAFSIPWTNGCGIASDTWLALGWSGGFAYDVSGGGGLGLREGPLVVAIIAGGGLDGFGAFSPTATSRSIEGIALPAASSIVPGSPDNVSALHVPFDAYAYVGGHLRYTTGNLRLDVSVAQTSGTAANERRYAVRLSQERPFDQIGVGVDLERIELEDLHGGGNGSAMMLGLSYGSSLEAPPR